MQNSILRCFRRGWGCVEGDSVNSARRLVMMRDAMCAWCRIKEIYLEHGISGIRFNVTLLTK